MKADTHFKWTDSFYSFVKNDNVSYMKFNVAAINKVAGN